MADDDKTLDDQISDMIGDVEVSDEPEAEEPEVGEGVVDDTPTEEQIDEVIDEPEEEEEQPEVEEPVEEGSEEEEVDEEEAPEEETPDEVKSLRQQVNALSKAALEQGVQLDFKALGIDIEEPAAEPEVKETPQQPQAQPQIPQVSTSYDDFAILMEGLSFEDFMEDEESFVKGMRNILKQHEAMLSQKFLTAIPGVVQNQVKMYSTLQKATDRFYEKNEDLQEVRPTVGAVANQLAAKNPSWTINKVMDESAKITRKILRLPSPSVDKKKGKRVVNPSFARSRGQSPRTKIKPQMTDLQKEIDDLLD